MNSNKIKLYKYCSDFTYLNNYCAQKIWLPQIRELNDPFENRYATFHPSPSTILNNSQLYNHYFQNMRAVKPNLTTIEFEKFLKSKELVNALTNLKYNDNQFMQFGILSLTTNPLNIPMWSYYAKNHEGYCVEFELDFSIIQDMTQLNSSIIQKYINGFWSGEEILSFGFQDKRFVILKVNYSEHLPEINLEKLLSINDGYERVKLISKIVAGTKFKDWSHEDEFRIITNTNSKNSGLLPIDTHIPFLKFSGIILGGRVKPQNKSLVTKLFNKFSFNYYQAKPLEDKYEISIISK